MKKIFTLIVIIVSVTGLAKGQVKIGNNPANINPNALLELETTSKGLLLSRLTTAQINAMSNPPDGMLVYDTTAASFVIRTKGAWKNIATDDLWWSLTGNAAINSNNFIGSTNNASFRLRTNNLQRLIVDSTGRVTIGEDSSAIATYTDALLHINNSTSVNTVNLTNSSANVNQLGIQTYVNGAASGSTRVAGLFQASGTGNSNTGITANATGGAANSGGTFAASGTSQSSNIAVRADASGPGSNYAVYASSNSWAGYFLGNSYFNNRVVLGLNTVPDNAQLTVRTPDTSYNSIFASTANGVGNGVTSTYTGTPTIFYAFWGIAPSTSNNYAAYFNGNVMVTGTFSNPSDERLKQNIQPLTSALDNIMKIGTHSYNFKSGYTTMHLPQGRQFGYLAQDIEGVFPELVVNSVDKSGGEKNVVYYKSVNYIGMIPVLTKALQEEHEQRMKTEEQLNTIKADNEALKNRLQAIENTVTKLASQRP